MSASLTFTVQVSNVTPATPTDLLGYRLHYHVTAASGGLEPKVFAFERPVGGNAGTGLDDLFYGVASLGQIAFLPVDAPATGPGAATGPFFRLDTLDLIFESPQELQEARDDIEFSLRALPAACDAMNALSSPVTITVP